MNTLPLIEVEELPTPKNQWAEKLLNQVEYAPATEKVWNQPPKRECPVYKWDKWEHL